MHTSDVATSRRCEWQTFLCFLVFILFLPQEIVKNDEKNSAKIFNWKIFRLNFRVIDFNLRLENDDWCSDFERTTKGYCSAQTYGQLSMFDQRCRAYPRHVDELWVINCWLNFIYFFEVIFFSIFGWIGSISQTLDKSLFVFKTHSDLIT